MTNGTSNYTALYNEDNMTAGGAAGVTTVEAVPPGDALGAMNSQQYGFQFGIDPPASGSFTAHTRIVSPFSGLTAQNYQSMGMFIGTGDQNNYVRIATAAQDGTGIHVRREVGGSVGTSRKQAVALPGPSSVDLYLAMNVGAANVQPSYAITKGGVTGPRTNLGSAVPIPTTWFSKGLAVGIISTSRGPGPVFPATWDLIEVKSGTGSTSTSTSTSTVEAAAAGGWVQRAPSGPVRQEVSYVKAGNKLYLTGGGTAHEAYNPATNTWTSVKPLPARLHHIQGVELGGKIYYIGGLAGWPTPHVSTVYIYDPAKDTFSQGAPMPRGRGAGGVAVHNGKIYYAGGLHNGSAVSWFDEYNPSTDTWRQLPNMPRAKDHFHAAVVNGKFFAIGGRNTAINATVAANDAFNFSTGKWSSNRAPLPTKRGGFAAAVLGDEILIIGGEGGNRTFATVEAYDVSSNTWRTLAPMPTPRHGIQAAVCNGGVYIAAGGRTQGGANPSDVHEAFFLNGQTTCGA
jgi:N-acetylneuraminic acid mutarotase